MNSMSSTFSTITAQTNQPCFWYIEAGQEYQVEFLQVARTHIENQGLRTDIFMNSGCSMLNLNSVSDIQRITSL